MADQPSNSIRTFFLGGAAGQLEALLNEGKAGASHAAVICHPHPMYGGTLHNKVVFNAMKALNGFGFPALRFNFRGAGLSHGAHDNGDGEGDDVRTALDWMEREYHRPIMVAGFSFGAAVGLRVGCGDPRVEMLMGLGLPVVQIEGRKYDFSFLEQCAKPKLFVSGSEDEFGPRAELEKIMASAGEPKEMVWIEGADHFFAGKLPAMRAVVEGWVEGALGK